MVVNRERNNERCSIHVVACLRVAVGFTVVASEHDVGEERTAIGTQARAKVAVGALVVERRDSISAVHDVVAIVPAGRGTP